MKTSKTLYCRKRSRLLDAILLIVLFAGLLYSCSAMENEIWITSQGPTSSRSTGTSSSPFRCPDAASLAKLFKTKLSGPNLTIHFMPGTFTVPAGAIVVKDGWKISGAGIDNTVLKYETQSANKLATSVIQSPDWEHRNGVTVSDLTVDCNFANQSNTISVGAVQMSGSNLRYSRLKVINWGTHAPELFLLLMGSDDVTPNINTVIEDCIITQPAQILGGGGVSGFVFVTEGLAEIAGSRGAICRNNYVYGVVSGGWGTGQPAYFHAVGGDCAFGLIAQNFFYDLTGYGSIGIYRDVYNGRDAVITGNIFDNVRTCIYFNVTQHHTEGVSILGNVLRPSEWGTGIGYYAGERGANTNAFARDLLVMGNVIYPCSVATNIQALMLVTHKPNTVLNNVIKGGGILPQVMILPPDTGTNISAGNVDLTGESRQ